MLEIALDMLADLIEALIASEKTPRWLRITLLGVVGILMVCVTVFLGVVAARPGVTWVRVLAGVGAVALLVVCVMGAYCLAAKRGVRS